MTLIDTPAFKTEMNLMEFKKMQEFVKDLKDDLGYVDVFLIVFNGGTKRYTGETDNMITLIEGMFANGDKFWNHVMLEVANWGFHAVDLKSRAQQNPPRSEQSWMKERIKTMRANYNIPVSIYILSFELFLFSVSMLDCRY